MLGAAGLGPWLPGDLTEQGFYSSFWEVGDDTGLLGGPGCLCGLAAFLQVSIGPQRGL